VKQLLQEYPGKIRVVVKFAPYPYRDFAKVAARASLAAREQGRFAEMHELLLQNYRILNSKTLAGLVESLGLDAKRFHEDLEAERLVHRVEQDVGLTRSLNIYQTPTFVIGPAGQHGRVLVGVQVPDAESDEFDGHLVALGYPYTDETENPAYREFMA